jgi:hypothetical protein
MQAQYSAVSEQSVGKKKCRVELNRKDSIKIDFQDRWESVVWIHVA